MKSALMIAAVCAALFAFAQSASADFAETFQGKLATDQTARAGWAAFTGSGEATVTLTQKNGHGFMTVDARKDRRNIYWALIKHSISAGIDRSLLGTPGHEVRVVIKLRISDAPRRVHIQINHTHTTDVHATLREFDLPDTNWHVISYTTKDFDAKPGDDVFVSLGMTDMGRAVYTTEIAYVKAAIVDPATAGPDLGMPLPYRPKLPPVASYANAVPVAQDATIDSAWPWVNLKSQTLFPTDEGTLGAEVLSVSGSQMIVLRFDLSRFKGRTADGWGILDLTTQAVTWAPTDQEEFGYLRTVEIKGGDPAWTRDTVTYDSFFRGKPVLDVLNGQLVFDALPALQRGQKTLISINPSVMARLLSGETKGLALYPQGSLDAAFSSSRAPGANFRPTLHFDVK